MSSHCAKCCADPWRIIPAVIVSLDTGVFWFVWAAKGFWWGVLFGLAWPIWIGYRLAEYLWR